MAGSAGFEVEQGALRAAARAARDAGAAMAGIDLAGDATAVGTAMPGSVSAGAAAGLSASWARGVAGWSRAANSHGDSLAASADTYQQTDTEAGNGLASVLMPGF